MKMQSRFRDLNTKRRVKIPSIDVETSVGTSNTGPNWEPVVTLSFGDFKVTNVCIHAAMSKDEAIALGERLIRIANGN